MTSANAHEILPRLWLGNIEAAADCDFQKKYGINVIFNCTKEIPFYCNTAKKYRVGVDDNLQAEEIQNLYKWAPEVIYYLVKEYKGGETILIHCHAGRQRSAAVVAMFLIAFQGKTTDEAIEYIRKKRAVAFFPSANFEKAIRGFEADFTAASG